MADNTISNTPLSLDNYKKNQIDKIAVDKQKQVISKEQMQLESDKVTLSYSRESITTYSSSMTLKGAEGDGFDLLRGLVLNILKEQGIDSKIATGTEEIDLNAISQEDAQALIAEDGYFGVEKTSDRIVDLAIGLAGDDPARLEAIKQGVEQGFQEALDAFGGSLPDISYDTYDAVMKKLDIWAGIDQSPES